MNEDGQLPEAAEIFDRPPSSLAEISREMVRIYKEQFGRGPTRARTEWAGPDQLLVTLEETLTSAERRLAELGEHQRLRDHHRHQYRLHYCYLPRPRQALSTGCFRGPRSG